MGLLQRVNCLKRLPGLRALPAGGKLDLAQRIPFKYQVERAAREPFEKFACVGGIPKYWEFVEAGQDAVALVESLYFDFAPYMEQEPRRILRDEGVIGLNAVAVLEAVGRGAERPSEIAGRLGTAQTNLSRPLQQLLDARVLAREPPVAP